MDTCSLYLTASSTEEAKALARALLERRLVACVNLLPGATSLYWWQGEIAEDAEVVMIAKTRRTLVAEAVALVRTLHGYDVPCAVALPHDGGSADYLAWVREETGG